jgi:hypothetical protein
MVASATVALWADRCPATFRFYTRAALQTRPRPGSALRCAARDHTVHQARSSAQPIPAVLLNVSAADALNWLDLIGVFANAGQRFPHTAVHYQVADLLALPAGWRHAFGLVVEIITVQALPDPPRRQAIENIAGLVAAEGTLLVLAAAHHPDLPEAPFLPGRYCATRSMPSPPTA